MCTGGFRYCESGGRSTGGVSVAREECCRVGLKGPLGGVGGGGAGSAGIYGAFASIRIVGLMKKGSFLLKMGLSTPLGRADFEHAV